VVNKFKKNGETFFDKITENLKETTTSIDELIKEINERKKVEEKLQKILYDCDERVKKLNCLYGISNFAAKQDFSLEQLLQGTVELIPHSWQYPEITCARIILESQEVRTKTFRETVWKQSSNIVLHGKQIGTVEVFYLEERPEKDEGPFMKEERSLINDIAERLAKIIEHNQDIEKIKPLSTTSSLTDSYNRLYLHAYLSKEIKRARRYGHSLSIVMCNIDNFKIINDTYGHQVGDHVLKRFGQYIKGTIREELDWVSQCGDEEFLIVLPETEVKGASTMIERLRRDLPQKISEMQGKEIHITASFGITGFGPTTPDERISAEVMINQADKYLYQSKQEGKNKVKAGQL
jgi:diguanylate cyclase (GGDEF)-like protein